jgi:hypothetical protein
LSAENVLAILQQSLLLRVLVVVSATMHVQSNLESLAAVSGMPIRGDDERGFAHAAAQLVASTVLQNPFRSEPVHLVAGAMRVEWSVHKTRSMIPPPAKSVRLSQQLAAPS